MKRKLLTLAIVCFSLPCLAQAWTQTWGWNKENNSTFLPGDSVNPIEPAGYASQSTAVAVPNAFGPGLPGLLIWENWKHDINVLSDAAFLYSWQGQLQYSISSISSGSTATITCSVSCTTSGSGNIALHSVIGLICPSGVTCSLATAYQTTFYVASVTNSTQFTITLSSSQSGCSSNCGSIVFYPWGQPVLRTDSSEPGDYNVSGDNWELCTSPATNCGDGSTTFNGGAALPSSCSSTISGISNACLFPIQSANSTPGTTTPITISVSVTGNGTTLSFTCSSCVGTTTGTLAIGEWFEYYGTGCNDTVYQAASGSGSSFSANSTQASCSGSGNIEICNTKGSVVGTMDCTLDGPTPPNWYLRIDNEVMQLMYYSRTTTSYGSVSMIANTMLVTRAQLSTTIASHNAGVNAYGDDYGFIGQHEYAGCGQSSSSPGFGPSPPPQCLLSGVPSCTATSATMCSSTAAPSTWPSWGPARRHPFGSFAYDSTDGVVLIGTPGSIYEVWRPDDQFVYCPPNGGSTSICTSGNNTITFNSGHYAIPLPSGANILNNGVTIWDPDQKVDIALSGDYNGGASKRVQVFCFTSIANNGCVPNQWTQLTDGTTTSGHNTLTCGSGGTTQCVNNPTAAPGFTAMKGVYDPVNHEAILWGGSSSVSITNASVAATNSAIYLLYWNGSQWNWLAPTMQGCTTTTSPCPSGNVTSCVTSIYPATSPTCPLPDWRPAVAWDTNDLRMLVAEPVDGAVFGGVWEVPSGTIGPSNAGKWSWRSITNPAPSSANMNLYSCGPTGGGSAPSPYTVTNASVANNSNGTSTLTLTVSSTTSDLALGQGVVISGPSNTTLGFQLNGANFEITNYTSTSIAGTIMGGYSGSTSYSASANNASTAWDAFCLQFPYMDYFLGKGLVLAMAGNGTPYSMGAWEMPLFIAGAGQLNQQVQMNQGALKQ